jgi:hypothetical protein
MAWREHHKSGGNVLELNDQIMGLLQRS